MTLHNSVELSQTKQCEYTAQLLSCSTVSTTVECGWDFELQMGWSQYTATTAR